MNLPKVFRPSYSIHAISAALTDKVDKNKKMILPETINCDNYNITQLDSNTYRFVGKYEFNPKLAIILVINDKLSVITNYLSSKYSYRKLIDPDAFPRLRE